MSTSAAYTQTTRVHTHRLHLLVLSLIDVHIIHESTVALRLVAVLEAWASTNDHN